LELIYKKFLNLPSKYIEKYKATYKLEYNQIIKQKVNTEIMSSTLHELLNAFKEHNELEYIQFENIFKRIRSSHILDELKQ